MARALVGIDLGTTNSALAYIEASDPKGRIQHFPVPQLVAAGETGPRELLASFLYIPGPHDLPAGATALPWNPDCPFAVGEFARQTGSRIPGRLVTSAKSWLCHAGVDRSAPLLPWSAPPDVTRISPVEASTRYLRHLVDAWNHTQAKGHADRRLEKQKVVLTVPASFDDMARTLTVEAAKKAGLDDVTLLEEPQAAFYCWLASHPAEEARKLKPGDRCLVVDVGGGTTDFTLIEAVEQEGGLHFTRSAIGDHLLLGGDNMDLALAKFIETRLPAAGKLDAVQYGLLTQACRQAKEALLGPKPPESHTVTIMGRGRSVIGGSMNAQLTPSDVRSVLLDGFFPVVPENAEPSRGNRTGLHEMGLPYVGDAAITRHLASFLRRHNSDDPNARPLAAILFNGGVFTPAILRDRILHVLTHWYHRTDHPWQPLVLTNPSLDLAVAQGAAHFAWLKQTGARRIGGGSARSYYVGIQGGDESKKSVLCVVPQGLEEGQELVLEKPELELALGQPVAFPLHTSTVRGDDQPGQVLAVEPGQLRQLPPLHTVLRGGKRSGTKSVPVTLAAKQTEIGTLELYCVARDGNQRWRLEFNVRDILPEEDDDTSSQETVADVWPEDLVLEAGSLIRKVYIEKAPEPAPPQLTKALEAALEKGRDHWPTSLCRRLWDFLAEVAEQRRSSPAHLARWFNLVGFCLRPGFGDPLDKFRIDQLWKLIHGAKQTLGPAEGGADFWILWRRVSGGLNSSLQNTLFTRIRPILLPGKGKNPIRPPANELAEMWRMAGSFERLDAKVKEQLGAEILRLSRRSPAPPFAFFTLTRLGARALVYGPLNTIVHPDTIHTWLDTLAPFEPGHDSERLAWAFCLAQLARKTGQRALDVDDSHRRTVLTVLKGLSIPGDWVRMVEEVTTMNAEEQGRMLGDALPIGLRLTSIE